MYVGRDMTELSMMSKTDWSDKELAYFHKSLQQMTPYLNSEGVTIHREIIKEIEHRGGFKQEADYEHGSQIHYD
ncbi:MAG: cytosolic protein [Bacillaceae bacterium]|uniref:Cytosolic protein n=1 Tax=Alkalihalobacterium chitinilyticum TaxID=2980103 RepID=A0ABT5VKA7_9BACI|nr:cytosolic protein [Alkalihalobacterium chitinilyticum]MDE5414868.1 cytosolic protein [Alkalihalobacterium chitinilyticum]MEB1805801.1 cytosolic protein [Bacillaceae bacterium]